MRTALLSAALLALAPAAHAVELGPLAPAADGKVQCYSPNPAAKSCLSIGTYSVTSGGVIENEAVVMVSSSPLVVMTTKTPIQIKGGGDCGVLHARDLATATFTLEGRAADPAQTARLRGAMVGVMKPMIEHEVCVFYRPLSDGVLATSAIDGRARPEMDQKVVWVSPADGWKVGF